MATAFTSLLGLALPVQGELSGTWGNAVNTQITALLDTSIAGTTTLSTDADVTLTTTTGASNEARQAIILWNATGTVTRNITAPAQSKAYIVINASGSTQSIVLRGAGPTTGITIVQGEKCVAAWNGTDFVKVANQNGAANFTVLTASSDSAFTSTGSVTVSKGTTAQRPASPVSGMFRFNTTTAEFEGFNGTAFASVGGAALSNDTATATSLFPLFSTATSGTASSLFTSNAQYLFKPSLGELSVKAVRASNGIFTNSATVSADATIASGDNGGSFGPTTINSGITLTVSSGSVYTVI